MKRFLKFFFVLFLILISFSSISSFSVFAISISIDSGFSDVISDLSKDENFSEENYPLVSNDYSLQLIQVAESSNSELFVYVYQPCGEKENILATSINISQDLHNPINAENYTLSLVSFSDVFYKYKVNGLSVKDDSVRFYEVLSIFRKWNSKYDKESNNENTIEEVVFNVGKQYTMYDRDGETVISVADTEVISVVDKYVGMVRYKDGYQLLQWGACDSHFVAF